MASAFIEDGFTRETLIPATKYHPAVKITYRPMLRGERMRLAQKGANAPRLGDAAVTAASQEVCKSLANHLKTWTGLNGDGEFPPISQESVAKLEPNLFEMIYNAVGGFDDEEQSAGN